MRVTTTGTQSITAKNTGNAGSSLSGTFGNPSGSGDFSRTGPASYGPLGQNGTASSNYQYGTGTRGSDSGSAVVISNAGNATINLAGTGVRPVYNNTPGVSSTLNFGNIVGGSSATLNLTVNNTIVRFQWRPALTNLTLKRDNITGPNASLFSLVSFTPNSVIQKGNNLSFSVKFDTSSASSAGTKSATLTIATDEDMALGDNGNSFSYPLQGNVTQPVSLRFDVASSSTSEVGGSHSVQVRLVAPGVTLVEPVSATVVDAGS